MKTKHASTRRPGAQPGNRNAYKHGFYSATFKDAERRLLSKMMPAVDLSAEIDLIRIASYRFLQALGASKRDLDFETQLTALRAVNLSAQSITALLRAQVLAGSLTEGANELLKMTEPPFPPDPFPAAPDSALPAPRQSPIPPRTTRLRDRRHSSRPRLPKSPPDE